MRDDDTENNGGFDDEFDELIRDRDYGFDDPAYDMPPDPADPWEDPERAYRRYAGRSSDGGPGQRGVADAIAHLVDLVAGAAGDALPPDTRRRLEGLLRDLLVALRDSLDRMIDRLDERVDYEVEIEEIRID